MPKTMTRIFAPLLALFLLLESCSKAPEAASAEAAAPVQVAAVKRGPIAEVVTAGAVLFPFRQANIVPKISAPVQRFLAQRGDHVHEGQLLAVLESSDLKAAADESEALYHQAQATYQSTTAATMPEDLTKAQADVAFARESLDAAKRLLENRQALLRQGALAQKLVDDADVAMVQARSQFETAQQHLKSLQTIGQSEQLKSARAQMEAAQAHFQSAQAQAAFAEVRSPINGVVSDRALNIGEMASTGSAVFSIVDISRVVARANIPVHQAALIHVGKTATISGPGGELSGKVTVVSPAVDPSTTTVEIWVEAANTGEKLTPGTTVKISINAGEIRNALVVPAAALLNSDEGGEKVMVAGSDSLAHEQKVEVGVRSGDDVQILSGVKEGDKVIVDGALGLEDKAKIQVGGKPADDKADDKSDKK
jgi:multidrug efflux pump subunit AcrA (membrane-fusion protein)